MLDVNKIDFFEKVETPFYYYEMDQLRHTVEKVLSLSDKYGILVHYAVKANTERRILEYMSSMGLGADCVSGNEVRQALSCGFKPSDVVFSGVGKTDKEIADALKAGIVVFNCESLQELFVLNAMAGKFGLRAKVSLSLNPAVGLHSQGNVDTASYENKFGIPTHEIDDAISLLGQCESLDFRGLHFHVGTQITQVEEVFSKLCQRANEIANYFESKGLEVSDINLGGGLGIDYEDPDAHPVAELELWFKTVDSLIDRSNGRTIRLEPGRSLVAQCATLISRVLYVKTGETKTFLILDAGMNDLVRPAFYGAYHKIENLSADLRPNLPQSQIYDVVGPVCESEDVWGTGRLLPFSVRGDLMAIRSAGAYGQVMANRYNLRDLAPAVFSDDMHGARLRFDYFGN